LKIKDIQDGVQQLSKKVKNWDKRNCCSNCLRCETLGEVNFG